MYVIEWPMVTKALQNDGAHWSTRAKKVTAQRTTTGLMLRANRVADQIGPCPDGHRLKVSLLRISPRKLDPGDNHLSSLKSVRDEIAAYFHVNDGDESRIVFEYPPQEKGPSTVRVAFAFEPYVAERAAVVRSVSQLATTPRAWAQRGMLKPNVVRAR